MSRSEAAVTADFARLGLKVHNQVPRVLASHLYDDEPIIDAVSAGTSPIGGWSLNILGGGADVAVLTDRRAITVKAEVITGSLRVDVNAFHWSDIVNVDQHYGDAGQSLIIHARGQGAEAQVVFPKSRRAVFQTFVDKLQRRVAAARAQASGSSGSDTVAQLERLNELRLSGAVSAEEFQAAKSKILGT